MAAVPDRPWTGSALFSVGVNPFSSSIEQSEDFTLIRIGIRFRLEPVPGGIDYVQHEREAELSRGKIMASRCQRHYRAYQIVGRHRREEFFSSMLSLRAVR